MSERLRSAIRRTEIRGDMIKPALEGLEEKFRTVRGGKGIAFVTPMTSLVGVAVYQFLSNKEK